jgi:hypothetical protein
MPTVWHRVAKLTRDCLAAMPNLDAAPSGVSSAPPPGLPILGRKGTHRTALVGGVIAPSADPIVAYGKASFRAPALLQATLVGRDISWIGERRCCYGVPLCLGAA